MRLKLVWTLSCVALVAACGMSAPPEDAAADASTADRATNDTVAPSDTMVPTDVRPDTVSPADARPDVPTPGDVVSPGDGGACSVPRIYSVSVMGFMAYFRFTPSGTWQVAMSPTEFDSMPAITGTYTVTGARITIVETGATTCPAGAMGIYDVAFSAACGMTWTLVSDGCASRSMILSGAVFTPAS
jgi:hypothetical protein